ncbi:hypothetical protein OXX59_004912 [Metschnikowia pulcherrima]
MDIYETAHPSEEFPYPVNITREDFADVAHFDPDEFLFKNHRYTSLDSLLADLRSLSKALNQDLLDLVNNEYTNFIQLGQSIGGCLELIDNLSVEIRKFKTSLGQTLADFEDSSATAAAVVQHKRSLNLLKNKVKLILVLNEQCVSFETLLGLNVAERAADRLQQKLHTLTTLHLSISKIYSLVMESVVNSADHSAANGINGANIETPINDTRQLESSSNSLATSSSANKELCHFFDNVVKTKVMALKFEFKSYLDELLIMAKADPETYSGLIMAVLSTYRVLGMSLEAVKTLKNKT